MLNKLFDAIFGSSKSYQPELPPTPKRLVFSTAVASGFTDSSGKWHATERDAEVASATRHMIGRMNASDLNLYAGLSPQITREEVLNEPDTKRAMRILGN